MYCLFRINKNGYGSITIFLSGPREKPNSRLLIAVALVVYATLLLAIERRGSFPIKLSIIC